MPLSLVTDGLAGEVAKRPRKGYVEFRELLRSASDPQVRVRGSYQIAQNFGGSGSVEVNGPLKVSHKIQDRGVLDRGEHGPRLAVGGYYELEHNLRRPNVGSPCASENTT